MDRCNICGIKSEQKLCLSCSTVNSSFIENTSILKAKTFPIFYIFQAFGILFKNPKLLKLSILPIILTLIILLSLYVGALYIFFSNMNQYLPSIEFNGYLITAGKYLLGVFGTLLLTILTFFSFLPVSSLVCIPFNDVISFETEKILLGESKNQEGENLLLEVKSIVAEVIKLLLLKILAIVLLLPLILIPVIGQIAFIFGLTLVTSIDFLDIIMARKKYTFGEKLSFLKNNFGAYILFSIPFALMFWIPLVQILLIPAGAIAGTKLFLESEKK